MNAKKLSLLAAINLALISTVAHADAIITSSNSNADMCSTVAGTWNGTGEVTTKILLSTVNCTYAGSATITAPAGGQFQLVGTLYRDDAHSNIVCPSSEPLNLSGTCDNNGVTISDSDIHFVGKLSDDGKSVTIDPSQSWVKFDILSQTITANVQYMNLTKQ